jgi:hypothetical protein
MVRACIRVLLTIFLFGCSLLAIAQQTPAIGTVPTVVNFSGTLADANGKPLSGTIGVTFYLYKDQQGGSPLWIETQNVMPDKSGHYAVTLGSTTSQGLPKDLFSSGEARWLGVQAQGQADQPRVMLLSVPYAMKAGDAATLGGLPPSAFMSAMVSGGGPASISGSANAGGPSVGGSGTQNYVPIWTNNSGDLGNSILYQTGSGSSARIGVSLKNPLATLDVNGTGLMRGLFEMATTGFATPTRAYMSNSFNFESSAFNSGSGKYSLNHFQWQAEPIGNNSTKPGATLNLLYGTDPAPPAETGLNIASNGQITFAAGQTFPGTGNGTITGVTAGQGLSGGGSIGNVSLGVASGGVTNAMLQNPALTITAGSGLSGGGSVALGGSTTLSLNSNQIPFLNTVNNFTNNQTALVNSLAAAISGTNTYVLTNFQIPAGVSGLATGPEFGVGTGVYGDGIAPSSEGQNVISEFEGFSGASPTFGAWGDVADFSPPNGGFQIAMALFGTADEGYAVGGFNNSTDLPTAYFENDGGGPTAPILQTSGPKVGGGSCSINGKGDLACTGTASPVVPVDNGTRRVALYAVESPENWFEDFGSGHLSNGAATISLEATFAQTVNTGVDYHVFLTPNGDSRGLYVSAKTATSFEVREQAGGTSSIAFDYRIVARRKGYENVRLADKTNTFQRPSDRRDKLTSIHSRGMARR